MAVTTDFTEHIRLQAESAQRLTVHLSNLLVGGFAIEYWLLTQAFDIKTRLDICRTYLGKNSSFD